MSKSPEDRRVPPPGDTPLNPSHPVSSPLPAVGPSAQPGTLSNPVLTPMDPVIPPESLDPMYRVLAEVEQDLHESQPPNPEMEPEAVPAVSGPTTPRMRPRRRYPPREGGEVPVIPSITSATPTLMDNFATSNNLDALQRFLLNELDRTASTLREEFQKGLANCLVDAENRFEKCCSLEYTSSLPRSTIEGWRT